MAHTSGLWSNITCLIIFSLVIDNFGMKYVDRYNAGHIIAALKNEYKISEDFTGGLYCGITLECNSYNEQTKIYVDISMPGYINKKLNQYQHEMSPKTQHSSYLSSPKKYDKLSQEPILLDEYPNVRPDSITRFQKTVGSIFYYAQSIDPTMFMSLSILSSEQSKSTT